MNYITIRIVINQLLLSSGGMNTKNMSKRIRFLSLLTLVMLIFAASAASATASVVTDVVRTLPDAVTPNTEFTVVLDIEGDSPLVVGIVEYIPQGLSFPDDDEDISSSCDFIVDRDNMTIAFSAIDINTISYKLVSSSTGIYDFSGEWVDLLYQDVEIDNMAERLEDISGDGILEVTVKSSSNSGSSSHSSSSGSTGSGLSVVSDNQEEATDNSTEEMDTLTDDDRSLKSTSDDSGNDDVVEKGSDISTDASIATQEEPESSVNSVAGFELSLSCLSFVLALAVVGTRRSR